MNTVTIGELAELLDEMIPLQLAESWDNVGLMLGRRNKPVKRILLALDMTQEVVAQAIAKKADMLLTHHPAIFRKLSNVTDADWQQELLLQLAEHGIAVYSAHTNLDCVANGVNAVLSRRLHLHVRVVDLAAVGRDERIARLQRCRLLHIEIVIEYLHIQQPHAYQSETDQCKQHGQSADTRAHLMVGSLNCHLVSLHIVPEKA